MYTCSAVLVLNALVGVSQQFACTLTLGIRYGRFRARDQSAGGAGDLSLDVNGLAW